MADSPAFRKGQRVKFRQYTGTVFADTGWDNNPHMTWIDWDDQQGAPTEVRTDLVKLLPDDAGQS